ncbi:MAG: hypothetical protein FJ011_19695 [Chloroflexi bacterium]|nr:hypothetical protein [Chloroflexota bacterium]
MAQPQTEPKQPRQPYEPPAVVYPQGAFGSEAALEVRAGSPLGKILGGPLKGLTDPAKLWTK